jgi:AbrB family transcriptional regulator (stage V sporulation protein T)
MRRDVRVKATGIVRRIDDLGRVVIPKEIRKKLRIREGAPLEIFVDTEGEVVLKKYSPVAELREFAQTYVDILYEKTGLPALVSDADTVVAVAGLQPDEWLDKEIPEFFIKPMHERKTTVLIVPPDTKGWAFYSCAVGPIVIEGDPSGAVILAAYDRMVSDLESKLVETAAGFLSKQIEQ